MANRVCGNCNFQGGSRADSRGAKVLCFYDNQWHEDIHTCDNWCEYSYGMPEDERLKIAIDLRNREATERRHKERLKSDELNRKQQIKIALFYFLAGVVTGLLVPWILSLWKK